MTDSQDTKAALEDLHYRLALAEKVLENQEVVSRGRLKLWSRSIQVQLSKIFGQESTQAHIWLPKHIPNHVDPRKELVRRSSALLSLIEAIERTDVDVLSKNIQGKRVFIGHGGSPLWRELKDFLSDRLKLPWDEFNREAVAGYTTFERISEMLDNASFAFLVMTAEDQHTDNSTHARQNVVHEVGLFQGKLGPKRAIILLEEGCSEFSNVVGLSQIRFPKGRISAEFEEIRRVLEDRGIVDT